MYTYINICVLRECGCVRYEYVCYSVACVCVGVKVWDIWVCASVYMYEHGVLCA